jgi:hypothetical protein
MKKQKKKKREDNARTNRGQVGLREDMIYQGETKNTCDFLAKERQRKQS